MSTDPRFHTTKWSVIVAAARTRSDAGSRQALESLCAAYWYPVYAFIRRSGRSSQDAVDLTQGYFTTLLEKDLLKAADPGRGRFRGFLLATVKQFLLDERKRESAIKRGGEVAFVTLDAARREERERDTGDAADTPDRAFERAWALTVFNRAAKCLEREFVDAGKGEQFRLLQPHLSGEGTARPYAEIAAALHASEGAVKTAVFRLRKRFGQLLRAEISETIDQGADVDAEMRHLLSVI